jgi:hypothetical protein
MSTKHTGLAEIDGNIPKVAILNNCARCGGNHSDIEFREFTNHFSPDGGAVYTHWAMCPTLNEPILMRFAE